MLFDYVLRNGRIAGGSADPVDVGVSDGRTAVIAPGSAMSARDGSRDIALDGRLMIPGFVETHIHLDKSCISDRCNWVTGTLQEAIAAAAECGGGGTGAAAAGDEARPHPYQFFARPRRDQLANNSKPFGQHRSGRRNLIAAVAACCRHPLTRAEILISYMQ